MSPEVVRVADPRRWLSTRAALIGVMVLAAVFVATLVVALLVWHTPAVPAIDVPSAPSA